MSLATTSGIGGAGAGGAAGGIAMAHHAGGAVGHHAPQPQQHTTANATAAGIAPPTTNAALGADLIDKNQSLSMKQVKNRQHLPIVAIDLHAADGNAPLAYFPKKSEDPTKGELPVSAATVRTDVVFQANNEGAQKTLRKYLSQSKTFESLQNEALATNTVDSKAVFSKPHHWLGLRRLEDAPDFLLAKAGISTKSKNGDNASNLSHAIAEESTTDVGVTIENSTLDGVSQPKNDDFDRVVAKVRLHSSKKAVTLLPEEAVQIVIHGARYQIANKLKQLSDGNTKKKNSKSNEKEESNEEEILEYPVAVALPAWAMHDSSIEALLEATDGSGVIVPRSVAAAAGALLPAVDGSLTKLLSRMNAVRQALQKQHQRLLAEQPDAVFEDAVLLILFGMTDSGFEATAIQVSTANMNNISCLFGEYKVLSNVSYQHTDPISVMDKCAKGLEDAIEDLFPEADGPAAIIFYGSNAEQAEISKKWESLKKKQDEWKGVPTFATAADTVSKGIAVMGGVAHGRLTKVTQGKNSSGKKKMKSHLGISVQHVAPIAVGVSMNYHGDEADADKKWTPIKPIFDFDRQVPAGPHSFDLNAAECVVYKSKGYEATETMADEDFLKATAQYEGAKGIPAREDAALNLRVQIYEKWTRDGDWKRVGDPMEPLVMKETNTDSKDAEEIRIACESIVLELSLAVTGMITTSLVGERTSVVVATKEARNSKIRWYFGILFLILFCGGFLFKSWYDDYVLERDTKRLLAFYHEAVPGSIHDGDEMAARYACYRYRNKKDKLWKKLENKYGVPVLELHEYLERQKAGPASEKEGFADETETVNLDDEDKSEDSSSDGEL